MFLHLADWEILLQQREKKKEDTERLQSRYVTAKYLNKDVRVIFSPTS